ncbi:helix-turn-helix transcriptional regulator [Lentilactobacillus buchneri]|uniref:helix-turn-helix transcriptional regulator n=1 Tax=Lentilactobacillus buchneri TaxID=1581 RepID=UPI0011EF5A85|nr:helix-turn-helix transcriptional regulator [Lentilactobacillus buchneri]
MIETKPLTWLQKKREDSELTQEEAASKANVSRTTYASIEQGYRRPSVPTAKKIASALNFEWTYFFE